MTDGDLYVYDADTTDGVKWLFQYRAAGAVGKKWEFIGGPPLIYSDDDARSQSSGTAYVTVPTDGISVTLPALAGDFDIEIQANIYTAGSGWTAFHSYSVSGLTNTDAAMDARSISQSNTATGISATKKTRCVGVTSGATLTEKIRTNNSGTSANVSHRRIIVTPVRVG